MSEVQGITFPQKNRALAKANLVKDTYALTFPESVMAVESEVVSDTTLSWVMVRIFVSRK